MSNFAQLIGNDDNIFDRFPLFRHAIFTKHIIKTNNNNKTRILTWGLWHSSCEGWYLGDTICYDKVKWATVDGNAIRCISSWIPSKGKHLGKRVLITHLLRVKWLIAIIWSFDMGIETIRVKCVPSKKGSTLSLSLNATRICPRCTHQGLCTHPWIRKPMTRGHRFVCQMSSFIGIRSAIKDVVRAKKTDLLLSQDDSV